MQKMLLSVLVFSFSFISVTTIAQSTNSNIEKKSDPISGSWYSVDNKEFLMMTDGFYSTVAQDSSGKWSTIHAGTYSIENGNSVTFKVNLSSFAYRVGYLHTIEYELNGENLTIKWYKKIIDPKAGDITMRLPKGQQTVFVRAKK